MRQRVLRAFVRRGLLAQCDRDEMGGWAHGGGFSLIRAIMGFIAIQSGRVLLDGEDITARKATERSRLGMALVPEGRRLFSDMGVMENLAVGAYARTRAAEARSLERVFALFPRLAERRGQVCVLASGRPVFLGTAGAARQDSELFRRYLGAAPA